ncbi:MAG: flagellar hook-basal body complex protein FliE [Planctomycetes bacterium]|jgi:flagellar hook-basal body complex protein FliE|nr:flagellar hook-basal body complex protein FliE [Planctomycetota bacterium]
MTGFNLPPLIGANGTRIAQPFTEQKLHNPEGARTEPHGRFEGTLADAIDHVGKLQSSVQDKVRAAASGEPVELHDVMMSMGKSEVAFNLLLEMRNKFVDAWEKLSRSVV